MASLTAGTTFTDGVANDVTAAKLGALVNNATVNPGIIQDRTAETVVGVDDNILISDASDSNNLKRMTVANLLKAPLVSTSGTVDNLTTGTTTSTAQIVTSGTFLGTITGSTNVVNIGSGQIYKDASGKVGIGTASPLKELQINATEPTIRLEESGVGSKRLELSVNSSAEAKVFATQSGSALLLGTVGTERLRIDASGNVGIGTASPGARLSVDSSTSGLYATFNSTSTNGGYLEFQSIGTVQGDIGTAKQIVSGSTSDFAVNARGARNLVLGTNNTERLRISSDGTILFAKNTASISTVGFRFDTVGEIYTSHAASTSASGTYYLYSTGAAAYRFYVGLGGTVNATNTAIAAISDVRLKENIRDIDAGLNKILELKPRTFDWKEGKGANTKNARGFIAQEIEQVFPDLVDEWRDPAPEGEKPYKSVRQDLIPVLVKAIQELKSENDSLKTRIEALEAA